MKKKLLAILLAACVVLLMAPAALAASVESCTGDCDHEAAIGSTHYDTLAEAMAAAENGSTVKLLDDLAIDTQTYTIVDGVSITLDMNEKKLTVTDSKTSGSYELFYIYGGLTVTGNGAIELTSTTDRGWNAMSAIFHNRGGVLTIEDGTFKNLGGTDMAWVVDNSGNWYGDATTNIEGGTLISTYTAIRNRMEQNEHGASGTAILNVSGGTISGTTSAIWAQAASVSTTAPATGKINISGGEIGLINTARSAGAECMTTISGGTVSSFKGEIGELAVTGGKITGEVTILTAADEETSYVVSGNGQYTSLKNAIANNSDITLQSNVTLTESIKISGAVTIDLNGYTIAGTDNSTGSFGLIEIQPGAELTINDSSADGSGKITLTATIDRDWNAFSSVISNQRGKLTVNGGTIQHLGGTDMPYGIDNLTNGKDTYAETVINGGTVKSTYRAIRQFLNGVEAQNILTVNGGTIEGTNKSIWMQDPSTNANSGTLTVDGGATLKGDVYLYVTPGSTEWPVTVSIASAALYGQSTVSYANVPAGYEVKTAGGYWGVDKVDESDPSVAAVKGVYFTALQEAISAAQSGDTVTLLADVELTETLTIPKGKSVTLDLNGKTISYSSDTAGEDMITNKGNLTITDNSDDQNGIITYCNTDTTASNVTVSTISCEPGSTLEVKSGTVKNDSANNALRGIYAYAIDILTNGSLGDVTVTISGGEVISAHYMAIRQFNNGDACKNTLVITGGKIYGATRGINIQLKNDAAYTTITGGTIEGGDYALCFFPENATHMTVTGGEFKGTIYSGTDGVISGGTFDAEPYETYIAEGYTLKSYTDGEGNTVYGVEPVYAVTISIPDGATIVVKDSKGVEAVAETDGTYKLVAGKYNYTVSKSGYNTKRGSFTVNEADMSFSVSLSVYIPYVPSGSGYHVTVEESENGGVSITPASATAGQIVTITVDPDKGYVLETLTVLDQNDKAIQLTYKGNGKYTFKMPASKVTVYATFMEDNTMLHDFTDVFASDYYYDAVLWAVENGITNGTSATTFSPNAVCTRAQVVTFLWRAAGAPEPKSTEMPFTDVASDAYYYDAALWAVENGITNGTSATTFSPDADCTRGQIVTFLWRAQGSVNTSGYNPFADVADDAYYIDAVLWAVENGITNGTGANAFSPNADCTRGQIVTFLYRCMAE